MVPLTEEQKKEFLESGKKYMNLKGAKETVVDFFKGQISRLEEEIRGAIPKTPHGRFVCKSCHVQSVAYIGRTPQGGAGGGDDIYKCEICGRDNLVSSLRYLIED